MRNLIGLPTGFCWDTLPDAATLAVDVAFSPVAESVVKPSSPRIEVERLEGNLGIPLPAATQWELVEKEAERLR